MRIATRFAFPDHQSRPAMTTDLTDAAIAILRANDRGGYTVPTASGLYPAQWNWDSCLVAFGFAEFDEDRAWTEIEMLFDGQWPDGMVPHILFHGDDSADSPNAALWQAGPAQRSSGITQPPVAATAVRHLFERFGVQRSRPRVRLLAPKLLAWHRWFHAARDPDGTGLVAILHPWESGMDDSPAWDAALAAVDPGAAVRPTDAGYDRTINLVLRYRAEGYRGDRLYALAPFRVADIGFNAILQRANRDLRFLLDMIDDRAGMAEVDRMTSRIRAALEARWDEAEGFYLSLDTRSGHAIRQPGIGGLLPVFADPAATTRHPALAARLERWLDQVQVAVPSFEPGRPEFDPRRSWRGPVSLAVNWMLLDGLKRAGRPDLAARIRRDSLEAVARSGFREYFDPTTGEGLGGTDVSRTAAIVLLLAGLED